MTTKYSTISSNGHIMSRTENENVYQAAQRRINLAFDTYDTVVVSFSGGKDSTTVLMLTLEIAKRRNRLPIEVIYFDDELIDPDTNSYCHEVANWDEVNFRWLCLPIRHTLQSKQKGHWVTWDIEAKDRYAYPIPDFAYTSKDFDDINEAGMSFAEASDCVIRKLYPDKKVCVIAGIRIEESFNRRRAIIQSGGYVVDRKAHDYLKPIFDWSWRDVWKAIVENGWPHSRFYDRLWMKGISAGKQRVAPWSNAADDRSHYYREFYPDFWEKAIARLPNLRSASRYTATKLYKVNKPAGMTWREYAFYLIDQFEDEEIKQFWLGAVDSALRRWRKISTIPFPEEETRFQDGVYNMCWRKLCHMIRKNDVIRRGDGSLGSRDTF